MELEVRIYTEHNVLELNDRWVKVKELKGELIDVWVHNIHDGSRRIESFRVREIKEIRHGKGEV